MLFSVIISYLLLTYIPEPLDKIIQAISIIGVIIHELCHLLLCLLTNTKVKKVTLVKKIKDRREENKSRFGGEVTLNRRMRISFLQAFIISFAPLYISFWLFFSIVELMIDPDINVVLFYIYLFILISITLAAAPSFVDLGTIPKAFHDNPSYSLYQIFLLVLSIFSVWMISFAYKIQYIHEILVYVFIFLSYYAFKYVFKGINHIFTAINMNTVNLSRKIKYKRFKRRYKPQ